MLAMKEHCQTCNSALAHTGAAWICSYECTFCGNCSQQTGHICPNCDGELVPRPRRKP